MDESMIAGRISQLRTQKGVTARDMSLSLGQSESYINKIENGRTLPSLPLFFTICDYFGITPAEFFHTEDAFPPDTLALVQQLRRLSPANTRLLLELAKALEQASPSK